MMLCHSLLVPLITNTVRFVVKLLVQFLSLPPKGRFCANMKQPGQSRTRLKRTVISAVTAKNIAEKCMTLDIIAYKKEKLSRLPSMSFRCYEESRAACITKY
eukprot:6188055-Pleurochrysis_carterae.AAC.2